MSTQNTIKTDVTADTRCARCDQKFGFGFSRYVKKHCCKFCGRGVCSSCSPQRVPNPQTSRIDRICNFCYQRVMTEHFRKTMNLEIDDLKKQKSEFYFALGQEIKNRAKICTKKRILEGILAELEAEAERKDREQRMMASKLNAEKDNKLIRMEEVVKKYNLTQRDIERKEKKLRDSEAEGIVLKSRISQQGLEISQFWEPLIQLRNKKIKLVKKFQLASAGCQNFENENYSELLNTYDEIQDENQKLIQDLSQLTAELEMKEKKIKNLQKKIVEATINYIPEDESDPSTTLKLKLEDQRKTIETLKKTLQVSTEDPVHSKPCNCLVI